MTDEPMSSSPFTRLAGRNTASFALAFAGSILLVGGACEAPETVGASAGLTAQANDLSTDEPIVTWSEPLINAAPKRTRTIAALMLDLGMGPPAMDKVVAGMESVRQMYVEQSYGMQDLVIDVVGPWKLPVGQCLTIACCGPSSDRTGNGATVMSAITSLGKTYDHYFYIYGPEPGGANCGTWGDAGNPMTPAKYCSIQNQWVSNVFPIEQELGHNLGMQHEHTLTCSGGAFVDNPSSCSSNEYGSRLSFMGMGSGHCSAYHKVHQGWLSGCNVVKAAGSGSYNLLPMELPCDGTQLLQIPMSKSRMGPAGKLDFFYAELRTPLGRNKGSSTKPTVVIYAGPDFPASRSYASHTYLLAQLTAAGQSFADPGGSPTITVESLSMTGARITIAGGSGAPTCLGGGAFTAPGPDAASCAAAPTSTPSTGTATGGAGGGGTGTGTGGASGSGGSSGGGRSGGATGGRGVAGTGGTATSGGAGGVIPGGSGGMTVPGSGGAGAIAGMGMVSTGGRGSGGQTGSGGVNGTGGSTASGGAAGSAAGTGGAPGVIGDPPAAGGCACTVPGPGGAPKAGLVLAFAFAWMAAQRPRRKRRPGVAGAGKSGKSGNSG